LDLCGFRDTWDAAAASVASAVEVVASWRQAPWAECRLGDVVEAAGEQRVCQCRVGPWLAASRLSLRVMGIHLEMRAYQEKTDG